MNEKTRTKFISVLLFAPPVLAVVGLLVFSQELRLAKTDLRDLTQAAPELNRDIATSVERLKSEADKTSRKVDELAREIAR